MKSLLIAAALLAAVPFASAQTALGSIEGVVVDTENAPVAGVSVYPVAGPASTGRAHGAVTNADGRFRIEQMVPGAYKLSAFKIEDGYADTSDPFYAQADHPPTTVTVSSATENADISIQLGARCGVLRIEANDAISHRPLTQATLVLQQRNSTGATLQGDKSLPADFLVPASDITVEIHQAGYATWKFADDGRDFVTLRPGEHRTVRANLQPLPGK